MSETFEVNIQPGRDELWFTAAPGIAVRLTEADPRQLNPRDRAVIRALCLFVADLMEVTDE